MSQIVTYSVVSAPDVVGLMEMVNKAINDKYQPIGGITVDGKANFYQAVV